MSDEKKLSNDDVVTLGPSSPPPSDPYAYLEWWSNETHLAKEKALRQKQPKEFDAICISGFETNGELTGDSLGLSSGGLVNVRLSSDKVETAQLRTVKFRIVQGAGSLSDAGFTTQLPHPTDENYSAKERNESLFLHPMCYSENEDVGMSVIEPGATIKVYKRGGAYFYRTTAERGLFRGINEFLNGFPGNTFGGSASSAFGSPYSGGPDSTMANIEVSGQTYSDANAFIKKLKDSGHFHGFSDQFLAGLTANAQAESALGRAKNDSRLDWVVGDRLTSGHSATAQKRAISGWCSHGYWQMNVCPGYAEGSLFAKDKGIDLTTEEGKNEFVRQVNDETILFSWMAMRMRNISEITPFISATDKNAAFNAGKAITQYFEKPAGCGPGQPCLKSNERGKLAQQMYDNYSNQGGSSQ